MQVVEVNNVQRAIPRGCRLVLCYGVETMTRNGKAKVLPSPLSTVYHKPTQRVSFYRERDANPFFHLFECLWMLAGRRDVAWLAQFNSNIATYSDDGVVFNAAYGHRWRSFFGVDQIQTIAKNLRDNPSCRRQVLSMWGVNDLTHQDTKDVPCNTQAFFQISPLDGALDMMVVNRSNDLIWGAYGANAVHFSFLLEVMAALCLVRVGRYTQVSMNTHLYGWHYKMAEELAAYEPDLHHREAYDPYAVGTVDTYPVVNHLSWLNELQAWIAWDNPKAIYQNSFFNEVASPMRECWDAYKEKNNPDRIANALAKLEAVKATDWRLAAKEWLLRRNP